MPTRMWALPGTLRVFILASVFRGFFDRYFLHYYGRDRLVVRIGRHACDRVDDVLTLDNATELCVTRRQWIVGVHYKELRAVRVWARVGHRNRPCGVRSLVKIRPPV